jgi:hypothetical protein
MRRWSKADRRAKVAVILHTGCLNLRS